MERIYDSNQISFVKGKNRLVFTKDSITFTGVTGFACFKEQINTQLAIKDILFFDYKAILFGLLGFKIAGGTSEQFIFKSLKKKDCLNIRQWLIDNGANFSNENSNNKDTFEHSGFHPLSKESLTILDTAIAHHRKTFFTNRDSVVPFDKVDFFITEKRLCFNKLSVVGQLSYTTHDSFPYTAIKKIEQIMKSKSLNLAQGKTYHPNIFSNVKKKRSISLIVLEDQIVYLGHRFSVDGVLNTEVSDRAIIIRKVTHASCKPIFSLFNRLLVIKGQGSTDLRTNKEHEEIIVFPGVFFFWWFCCGKLKTAVKALKK